VKTEISRHALAAWESAGRTAGETPHLAATIDPYYEASASRW